MTWSTWFWRYFHSTGTRFYRNLSKRHQVSHSFYLSRCCYGSRYRWASWLRLWAAWTWVIADTRARPDPAVTRNVGRSANDSPVGAVQGCRTPARLRTTMHPWSRHRLKPAAPWRPRDTRGPCPVSPAARATCTTTMPTRWKGTRSRTRCQQSDNVSPIGEIALRWSHRVRIPRRVRTRFTFAPLLSASTRQCEFPSSPIKSLLTECAR